MNTEATFYEYMYPEQGPDCNHCHDSGWLEQYSNPCLHCNPEGDQR